MTRPRWLAVGPLLLGAMLTGCGSNPSPSNSTAPFASAESTIDVVDPGWERVDLAAPADVQLGGAYAGPAGLVILGGRFAPIGPIGFTWTSRDGISWRMQATPGPMIPASGASIGNVEVLLGAGGTGPECAHPSGERTWARRDGGDWAAAPFQGQLFCAGGGPELAAGDSSFVVAGSGTGDQPFAWWSIDGLIWHDIPVAVDPFPLIRGLVWDGGRFWIVARDEGGVVAMTSVDGRRWTSWSRVVAIPGLDPIAVVPRAGEPLLFTGTGGPTDVWRLKVGEKATALQPAGLGDIVPTATTASGRLYLSVAGPGASKLLTSVDGTTWSGVAVPPAPGLIVTAIADDGAHLLVVGSAEVGGATTWSAWIGKSPDVR